MHKIELAGWVIVFVTGPKGCVREGVCEAVREELGSKEVPASKKNQFPGIKFLAGTTEACILSGKLLAIT